MRGIAGEIGGMVCLVMSVTANSSRQRRVELEPAEVGGEQEDAAGREQRRGRADEPGMVALDVERALHALGVGEGGGVEEDQVVRWAPGARPRRAARDGGPAAVAPPRRGRRRSSSHSRQSARTKPCCGPARPFSSRLRAAHSR